MKLPRLACLSLLLASLPTSSRAQQLFGDFLTPSFRLALDTEYTQWDLFSNPYLDPNEGDTAAADSAPTIIQNGTASAFLTSGFNIYSPSGTTAFELANDTTATIGTLNTVVFQFETLGTTIDSDSIKLRYNGGASAVNPVNLISENRVIIGGFGGFTNHVAVQWNLTGLNISDYTITFTALGSSSSFGGAVLDTSGNPFVEVVPSARTWDGAAGDGKWSSAANWSANTVTSIGGNVTFDAGSGPTIDLDSNREVGLLQITRPGTFAITPSGGALLTINTGITADAGGTGSYQISAPLLFGGHNFMDVAGGTTLTLSGPISGDGPIGGYPATGIYKTGGGTLAVTGENTFTGGITVDGGTMIVSGVNSYTSATSVLEGALILQGHAPSGSAGTLGSATSNVSVGYDPGATTGLPGAQVLIDGNFTVGRSFSLSAGTLDKVLGGRNTTSALYSGTVSLATTTDNVFLRAESVSDVVTFSGQITGGGAARTLIKDGAGTVIFSGVNKTYASNTIVSAGTLQVAGGTGFTSNGNLTVASGATLIVHGSLSGSGTLAVNGGTIGGSGTINRPFTLDIGDVLSPGASVGALATVGQTWANGGRFKLELTDADATAGLGWDVVNLTGTLDLSASAGGFTLELRTLTAGGNAGLMQDFNPAQNYTWKFAGATGGITGFAATDFTIGTTGFQNAFTGGSFRVTQSGNDLFLNFQAVPEPSSALLLGCGSLLLTRRRRRASARA